MQHRSLPELNAPERRDAPTIGERLERAGSLNARLRGEVLAASRAWGVRFGEAAVALGHVSESALASAIARQQHVKFVDLEAEPPDPALALAQDLRDYARHLYLPWRRDRVGLTIASADLHADMRAALRARYGSGTRFVSVERAALLAALERRFRPALLAEARYGLARRQPQSSARRTVTPGQALALYAFASAFLAGLAIAPAGTLSLLIAFVCTFHLAHLGFRLALLWRVAEPAPQAPARPLPDRDLPVYSILVPLFREANVLPGLARSLAALDYPAAKLDIKLILEAGDGETIAAARALARDPRFELIVVPHAGPQTKPKALNYALPFVRGEFLAIYDAEDRPEPDQLRKAAARFRVEGDNVACLQARLNFYNARENWLTRLFALEYALWFDFMLPGLDSLRMPIPLGGTSNHFRVRALEKAGAWDAFNVTEDADLGLRLAACGYAVATLESTTYEEANTRLWNWVRQRTRWIKGYIQTWLVQLRAPFALVRRTGWRGLLAVHGLVGGTVLSALVNPVFWILFAVWLVTGTRAFEPMFGEFTFVLALVSLIAGNLLYVFLMMAGPYRRGWFSLAPFALCAPAYWALISVAAYRALGQFFRRPSYWEKTDHGLSAMRDGAP